MAMQLFAKTFNNEAPGTGEPSALDDWLRMLDRVRMSDLTDVKLLRSALESGLAMAPIPKETWELARVLSRLTGDPWAIDAFARLQSTRRI